MSNPFFDRPILNSPYEPPTRHWELDASGQPTQQIVDRRRAADFITPIPKPKKRKAGSRQADLGLDDDKGLSTEKQRYDVTATINEVRGHVENWRRLPNPSQWQVTPETARLLIHWRRPDVSGIRPFFCQVEAVETTIWLTEVAPHTRHGKRLLDYLEAASREANPELLRLALKLATGAGKTTVMAMLIAWQTVNAVRRPGSKTFTKGFLVVTPGITIKDRLRVLLPNDLNNYYADRDLVPGDMLEDIRKARIVLTNYHAFKLRERLELSKGGRALLKGRTGEEPQTLESEGQMLQRVMPELMGMKNILVLNDEAHHCYREKPPEDEDEALKGEERKEAEEANEAARLWISGLEAVNRKLGLSRVIDLSATPFFLRGSGYAEGTLFPWTMSDFSLMDAIECGIVKLPRVPVAENIPGGDMPMFRNLWENIRDDMPKKGRGKAKALDPLGLPAPADRVAGAVRPLREDLHALAGRQNRRAALLHHRLQQHLDLEAGLRLRLRLPSHERRRLDDPGERPARAVPQLRRQRQCAGAAQHPADRQQPARIGRGAGYRFPRPGSRRDRALQARGSGTGRPGCRRHSRRQGDRRRHLVARGHEHGRQIPREADKAWPEATKKLHAGWWDARIARQKEIDASIAAKADYEYLYDRPYQDNRKVRVAGPFTVESLSPHRVLGVDENDELIDGLAEDSTEFGQKQSFPEMILENLKTAGVQQAHKEGRIAFASLVP